MEERAAAGSLESMNTSPSLPTSAELDDASWLHFRERYFNYQRLNLNPGTLSSRWQLPTEEDKEELAAYPLGSYQQGRAFLESARGLADALWPSTEFELAITAGTSQCLNSLQLSLLAALLSKHPAPVRVLSTANEHKGGIGGFDKNHLFELFELNHNEEYNTAAFKAKLRQWQPQILFLSHLSYNLARLLPVAELASITKEILPQCVVIVDAAQSLGLLEPPLTTEIDFVLASFHKWLAGPLGTGILFVNKNQSLIEGIQFNGESLSGSLFEMAGGHDFDKYQQLTRVLEIVHSLGLATIARRSQRLCAYFASSLFKLLQSIQIKATFMGLDAEINLSDIDNPDLYAGYFSVDFASLDSYQLYSALNEKGIHCKCIKDERHNILRFGFQFFESTARLDKALTTISACLENV